MRESKRIFSDRGNSDWKKAFEADIMDAKMLGLATGKGFETDLAKSVMEKVNSMSGVAFHLLTLSKLFQQTSKRYSE